MARENATRPDPVSWPVVTRSRMVSDLSALGVSPGMTVLVHASMRALGWVVGGPEAVLQALLDVLGPRGTILMGTGWEDGPRCLEEWPEETRKAYLEECPAFHPLRARARRDFGALAECLRTWPGASRSDHPEASMAAVGRLAQRITSVHPPSYAFGQGSPLQRFVELDGKVLLLGADPECAALLRYAENVAWVPGKRVVHYRMPVLRGGQRVWEAFEDYDTRKGMITEAGEEDCFRAMALAYLLDHPEGKGRVGEAEAHLLDGRSLVAHAVRWMEQHLGQPGA